tara:strand:+ start:585 stop:752 length:168 start_codon:yes stop_codon:yes gene_type:complete
LQFIGSAQLKRQQQVLWPTLWGEGITSKLGEYEPFWGIYKMPQAVVGAQRVCYIS